MPPRGYRIDPALPPAAARTLAALLDRAGWTPAGDADWQLLWTAVPPSPATFRAAGLSPARAINQLPGLDVLTSKYRLREPAEAARRQCEQIAPPAAGYLPSTYNLPDELDALKLRASQAPDIGWLRRPKTSLYGEGAKLLASVDELGQDARWLIQELVAEPHLVDGVKYSLRCYALIASLDPLRLYLHRDGRVMMAARPYDTSHLDEADRVLTTRDAPFDFSGYRSQLAAEGHDVDALWRRIERMLATTVMAARGEMLGAAEGQEYAIGRSFALLEFDLLLDRTLTPWLLECQSWPAPPRPSQGDPAQAADVLTERLLTDALALIGALAPGDGEDIPACERLAPGFVRLVPSADPLQLALFAGRRPDDVRAARAAAAASPDPLPLMSPHQAGHALLEDSVLLYADRSRELYILNPTASCIWLACADGARLNEVAAELATVFPDRRDAVEQDVWTTAIDWIERGLLAIGTGGPPVPPRPPARASLPQQAWNAHAKIYRYLHWRFSLRAPGSLPAQYLQATLVPFEAPSERECDAVIEVTWSPRGYQIWRNQVHVAGPVWASSLAAVVHRQMLEGAYEALDTLLAWRATIVSRGETGLLLLGASVDEHTRLGEALEAAGLTVWTREALLLRRNPPRLVRRDAPDEPLRVRRLVVQQVALDGISSLVPLARPAACQALLTEDLDMVPLFDAAGAGELADFLGGLLCSLVTVGDPHDAASSIAVLLDEVD